LLRVFLWDMVPEQSAFPEWEQDEKEKMEIIKTIRRIVDIPVVFIVIDSCIQHVKISKILI
jgi:hypothetical protein